MNETVAFLTSPGFTALCNVVGVLGVPYALYLLRREHRERARLAQPVTVLLTDGARMHRIEAPLRRGDLTRAELQGRLGNIPTHDKKARYSLDVHASPSYIEDIEAVRRGTGKATLVIPCTPDELSSFNVPLAPVSAEAMPLVARFQQESGPSSPTSSQISP